MSIISFFRRIFGFNKTSREDISIITKIDLDLINNIENNTKFLPCQYTSGELISQGYKKVQSHVGVAFSQFPSFMGTAIASNSYQIKFPDGFSIKDLIRLKKNNGLTTVLTKDGSIKGSAWLVSTSPAAVAMGVFTVLSVVTSQYFLAEINKNILYIKQRLNDIATFLNVEKRSEILANIDFLCEIYSTYEFIVPNANYQQAVLTNILNVKNSANASMKLYAEMIRCQFSELDAKKNNKEEISHTLASVYENTESFKLATALYMCSVIMQLIYSDNIVQDDYVRILYDDMIESKELFVKTISETLRQYNSIIAVIQTRPIIGSHIKSGKYDPDQFFNSKSIEEDKNCFCDKYIEMMDQIKLLGSNNAAFIICDDDLYMHID